MELKENTNELENGYLLHWYAIKSVIGRGGFGITYLAHDNNLDRSVAIKEFMPEDFAMRSSNSRVLPKQGKKEKLYKWGLRRFVDEARTLAKFNHPNIIRVLSVFEENNTAYMVMEYAQGKDLSFIYKKNEKFTEEKFLDTFIPIMDGLALVHDAGFIHRDIKPANIYLCDNNAPLLLDFGSARQSMSDDSKALTSLVTFGYAPFEQYNEGTGKEGPWTDIYSLGASIYMGITGKKPIDALCRGGGFLENGLDTYKPLSITAKGQFSDNFLLAIDNALMFKIDARPKDIMTWADMLLGKIEVPCLPDYMQNAGNGEDSTVMLPWTTNNTAQNTVLSKTGQRGLIDVHGKRHTSKPGINTDRKNVYEFDITNNTDEITSQTGLSVFSRKKIWIPLIVVVLVVSISVVLFSGIFKSSSKSNRLVSVENIENIKNTNKRRGFIENLAAEKKQAEKAVLSEKNKKILALINKAKREFAKGNFASGAKNNAYYYYAQALKIDAENQLAKDGIYNIQNKLLKLADIAYEKNEFIKSRRYLAQLSRINGTDKKATRRKPRTSPQQTQKVKSQEEIKSQQEVKSQQVAMQIKNWLKQAEAYKNNQQYIKPEKKNAFELYKKVLQIDSNNMLARAGIDYIQQHYTILFNTHLSKFQLGQAEDDLKVMRMISTASAIINGMQKTLNNFKKQKAAEKNTKKINKPKKLEIKKVSIVDASEKIALFKKALQARNKSKIKKISIFISGREQFVDQLIQQYRKFEIQVSGVRLIPTENKVLANVELDGLTDINGNKVIPGSWSKFQIAVRYDEKNNLVVYW